MFSIRALQAVVLNKALSLVVVAAALPFRAFAVPLSRFAAAVGSAALRVAFRV